jgi:Sulfotransferase domain
MTHPVRSAAKAALRQWGIATAGSRTLPDFIVVGTKRGGTTSMWNYLLDHPLVLPMFPTAQHLKSPHYFYWHYDKGERWYRSHFATQRRRAALARSLDATPLAGEASPYYLYNPHVPARVRALLPDVKLIVMLRDPVARAYSHYWERVNDGSETLSFDDAIAQEDDRLAGEAERMAADPLYYSRPHDYFSYRDRGIYLPQLQRWFAEFPRDQVLVTRSEDFYADAQSTYDDVTAFLGLPHHHLGATKRFNRRPAEPMSDATRTYLTRFFTPHNAALNDYLGRDFEWSAEPDLRR